LNLPSGLETTTVRKRGAAIGAEHEGGGLVWGYHEHATDLLRSSRMPYDARDPDAQLVATFLLKGFQNDAKTTKAGRPIYDDIEICEIRVPGSREVKVFPATEFSHWGDNIDGRQVKVTYAERFARQYRQFKEHAAQTKSGTPLEHAPFLTDGKRAELRALNVYTVEQLAEIEGAELKNLGTNGR
jgi:hypothetical protein